MVTARSGRGWAVLGLGLLLLTAGRAGAAEREVDAIERAWLAPAPSLEERVLRTRRVALEHGLWNHDAAALALLASPGSPVERAAAAVALAPDLPIARIELARALWIQGGSPLEALRTALGAGWALVRHVEGSLWLLGSAAFLLAVALMGGGIACMVLAAAQAARFVAHDLGDVFSPRGGRARGAMPAFARLALLGSLLLAPLLLGEGLLGLAVALFAVGFAHGGRAARLALALAAAALVAGAWPVARAAGSALEALAADPVARAALAADRGVALASDVALLEERAESDPLAAEALARLAVRQGSLARADVLYQALHAQSPDDPVLANNAANVRLRLGHVESALSLYERALVARPDAAVLYNLSQAHGRGFQVEEMTRDLARAQQVDGDLVGELTRLQAAASDDFVVDLPIAAPGLRRRLLQRGRGLAFAEVLRAPLAPGRLGDGPEVAGTAFVVALAVAAALGRRLRPSRACARCAQRICPRCDLPPGSGDLCEGCHRLFFRPEQTDRQLRAERLEALERRRSRLDRIAAALALAVPGAAGFAAGRPVRGLIAAVLFAFCVGAIVWRNGVVPDPLATGAAGPFALLAVAALGALAYAALVTGALTARRSA